MKAKTTSKKPATVNIELNRWCIEMAMAWPGIHFSQSGNAFLQGGLGSAVQQYQPSHNVEAAVIGRAGKILAWVKTAQ